MAIQITRWSPDTCDCIVEYSWDDNTSEDTRIHTIANVVNRCVAHQALVNKNTHFNTLMEENPRKNKILEGLRASFPALTRTDNEGNIVLKDGIISWSFDANRVLQVSIPSLSPTQRTVAQTWADNNLGVGKAKVN